MSTSPVRVRPPRKDGAAIRRAHADARAQQLDTIVLRRVSWIMLALGVVTAVLFALDPDPRAHPGLFLLAITGLVGTGMLRLLAHLLRTPPQLAEAAPADALEPAPTDDEQG